MKFSKGDQIAYIPMHAQLSTDVPDVWTWDEKHPDIEYGFVTSQRGETVFCRYWRKGQPGTLRTVANSEGTPEDCLVRHKSVLDGDVWGTIQAIDKAEPELQCHS